MSLIRCSYKYRMYPNKTQEELLAKTFGCVRVIWNACVDSFNSYDKETNPNPKFPTKSDLVIEKPWLNEVSAATLQQKQRDFIEFSRQYFNKNRKEKLGKPNYKNKHDNQSFRLPFPKFKITNNKIRIEKIGWVKIVIDRKIPDNARFISCTVSKNRSGQYFVSVLVETEQCYKHKTGKTVGVDLGIKTLATLSDASFSMFRNQLEYKCRWYGKELVIIDRFYPSSKTCSRCGWKNKDLKLSDRTFICKNCGLEIDRDLNAAINIQAVGVDAAILTQSSRVAGCVEASKME